MAVKAMAAVLIGTLALAEAPADARGHHGFHGHRGGGFHGRAHCRTYKDQDVRRQRVCV